MSYPETIENISSCEIGSWYSGSGGPGQQGRFESAFELLTTSQLEFFQSQYISTNAGGVTLPGTEYQSEQLVFGTQLIRPENPFPFFTKSAFLSTSSTAPVEGDNTRVIISGAWANFTASYIPSHYPTTVQFTDLSMGNPESYLWEFGDGQTSTDQNPIHTYTTYGSFTVSLTVNWYEIQGKLVEPNFILVFGDDSYVMTKSGQYNGAGNEVRFRSLQGKFKLKVTNQGTIQLLWGEQDGEYTQFLEVPSSATDMQKTNFKFFLEQQSEYQEANVDDIVICKGTVS